MVDYRSVPANDGARYRAIARQAFDTESGPMRNGADDEPDEWPPELSDPRGVFVDGELRSICKLYYLDATVRGEWTEIGGLGSVATPPEHRRQGFSREALRGALEEYRENGVDLVALWPSTVRFYRGLGWGVANWNERANVPPAQLAGIEGAAVGDDGRFCELDVDDWERLRAVEVERARRFGLSLRRSEAWWRQRTLAAWPDGPAPYVYGYESDGDLRGYAIVGTRESDGGRQLKIEDLAGVDHAAERALLGLLANHESQVETVRLGGPIVRDVQGLVPDPGEFDVERSVGTMIRLTDVERGLGGLPSPASAAGEFVLDVTDPLLDHGGGPFAVGVGGGTLAVTAADADEAPDVAIGIGTLSRLAIGSIEVDRAERLGDLEIHTEAVRSTLAAAFPAEPICLREFF